MSLGTVGVGAPVAGYRHRECHINVVNFVSKKARDVKSIGKLDIYKKWVFPDIYVLSMSRHVVGE